jgi:hypothetical protein
MCIGLVGVRAVRGNRAIALVTALASIAAPAWGQSDNCLERTIPLSIISRDGSQLPSVNLQLFNASIRGKPVEINSVAPDQSPRRILILVDVSASFIARSAWSLGVAADLLDRIPPPSEIGIASFSKSLNLLAAPTTDRARIRTQLDSIYPPAGKLPPASSQKTVLWDALEGAGKLFDSPKFGDVIFLITDGVDNGSKASAPEATRALEANEIRLFALQVVDPFFAARMRDDPRLTLWKVASETGGMNLVPQPGSNDDRPDMRQMPLWFRHDLDLQYQQILYIFRVNLRLPEALTRQERWVLSVASAGTAAKGKFEMNYPRTFLPCP